MTRIWDRLRAKAYFDLGDASADLDQGANRSLVRRHGKRGSRHSGGQFVRIASQITGRAGLQGRDAGARVDQWVARHSASVDR